MAPADTTARRTLAWATALLAALLLAGCGESGPERDGAGAITGPGEVRLLKLRVGDCVADLRHSLDNPDGGHNGVPKVKAVACSQRHDAEVLKIAKIGDGDWPGFAVVDGEAARGRQQLQPRLTAAAPAAGRITLVTFRPTQDRWEFESQHQILYLALYRRLRTGTL
jgi:hypothetical protein